MSIKGKGKTKARQAPRAPRHEPVPVKPPFLLRRWVQVVGAFVLGFLTMLFLVWVTNGLREQRRLDRTREREATELQQTRGVVAAWQGVVDAEVGTLGEIPSPGIPPTLLPAASAVIDGVAAGDEVRGAQATLHEAETALDGAIGTLNDYALLEELRDKGFDIPQTNYLLNSKTKIVEALRIYREAVAVAQRSSAGDQGLGRIAAELWDQASTLFADGWRDLEQVKQSVGIDLVPETTAP